MKIMDAMDVALRRLQPFLRSYLRERYEALRTQTHLRGKLLGYNGPRQVIHDPVHDCRTTTVTSRQRLRQVSHALPPTRTRVRSGLSS